MYQNGLAELVAEAIDEMDNPPIGNTGNRVPGQDNGGTTYSPVYTELYSMLFAFMSLVETNQILSQNYASRARTLLMHIMNQAVLGSAEDVAFRDPSFAVSDRSRWAGHGFALTVDWLYPYLSPADKSNDSTGFFCAGPMKI